MKAYVVSHPREHIELWQERELRDREVDLGAVVIKVKATYHNCRDLMIVNSPYGAPNVTELVPISDGAGEAMAVGSGVTKWAEGDRSAFPGYEARIVVRRARTDGSPGLANASSELSGKFNSKIMRGLNYVVDVERKPVAELAAEFLSRNIR